jgi:hypothetical protein
MWNDLCARPVFTSACLEEARELCKCESVEEILFLLSVTCYYYLDVAGLREKGKLVERSLCKAALV